MVNGLWYHRSPYPTNPMQPTPPHHTTHGNVHKLTHKALYELYHQRLGHRGKKTLSKVHKHVKGIPQLKGNSFYLCASCAFTKITRRKQTAPAPLDTYALLPQPDFLDLISPLPNTDHPCGGSFHMDIGFPRGKYEHKGEFGRRVTSIDKHNSYLLIIDRKSRYTWVMLSNTKQPPLKFLEQFPHEPTNHEACTYELCYSDGALSLS